jgi:hypothetical protein
MRSAKGSGHRRDRGKRGGRAETVKFDGEVTGGPAR